MAQRISPWETLGPTWIEVDLDVLSRNFTEIAAYVSRPLPESVTGFAKAHGLRPSKGPPKVMVVVKSDAYGHGAAPVAEAAVQAGAAMLGVSTFLEGAELRQVGLTIPILLINPLTPAEAESAVRLGLTPTVTGAEAAAALSQAARRLGRHVPVHVSVDTGMSRYGVRPADAARFVREVSSLPGLEVEGLYTHFSAGADASEAGLGKMRVELRRFVGALAAVEAAGIHVPLRHAASSSAVLRLPESYFDMVRVGNLFYGYAPRRPGGPAVEKAWKMRTRILEVRDVPPGTGVGYGPDVIVRRATRLATVPIGYADGVGAQVRARTQGPRALLRTAAGRLLGSLRAMGLLRGPLARFGAHAARGSVFTSSGRPIPIVGRISMQQTILDITALPDLGPGSPVEVQVPRTLAASRLVRVYRSHGAAVEARTICGIALAAAGWRAPVTEPPPSQISSGSAAAGKG